MTLNSVATDLGPHCLPITNLEVSWLKWVTVARWAASNVDPDQTPQKNKTNSSKCHYYAAYKVSIFTTLLANLADNKSIFLFFFFFLFLVFPQKIGFHISWKLSSSETLCMKCKSLFSGKSKKKIFQNVVGWNFYPACQVFSNFSSLWALDFFL